jgi:hypothetical protein
MSKSGKMRYTLIMTDHKNTVKNTPLTKDELNEFYIHTNTMVDFNRKVLLRLYTQEWVSYSVFQTSGF